VALQFVQKSVKIMRAIKYASAASFQFIANSRDVVYENELNGQNIFIRLSIAARHLKNFTKNELGSAL
jgi:hypothetical protein